MRTLIIALIAVGLAGCASVDLPPTKTNPEQTIAAAEERGVQDNPKARLHLQMAKDAIENAKVLMDRDDEKEAKLALMRAEADADLALAMVRLDSARDEVRKVQTQIDELQNQMRETIQ